MIRRRHTTLLAGTVLASLTLLGAACGSGGSASASSATTTNRAAATVSVANSNLGNVLVDAHDRTLYLFRADMGTKSACSGACALNWPPLVVNGTPTAGNGAETSLVATTTRSDGKRQLTYNGHPVYRFSGDQKAGDTNGQGINEFGGTWYALTAAGNQVSATAGTGGNNGY